jgi:hypothetical protein
LVALQALALPLLSLHLLLHLLLLHLLLLPQACTVDACMQHTLMRLSRSARVHNTRHRLKRHAVVLCAGVLDATSATAAGQPLRACQASHSWCTCSTMLCHLTSWWIWSRLGSKISALALFEQYDRTVTCLTRCCTTQAWRWYQKQVVTTHLAPYPRSTRLGFATRKSANIYRHTRFKQPMTVSVGGLEHTSRMGTDVVIARRQPVMIFVAITPATPWVTLLVQSAAYMPVPCTASMPL